MYTGKVFLPALAAQDEAHTVSEDAHSSLQSQELLNTEVQTKGFVALWLCGVRSQIKKKWNQLKLQFLLSCEAKKMVETLSDGWQIL